MILNAILALEIILYKIILINSMVSFYTYLIIWHSSEGENPLKVKDRLTGLGFKPLTGYHDYEYDHGGIPSIDDILGLSIKVHETLKGSGVMYKLESKPPN